jgi:plastocyanin
MPAVLKKVSLAPAVALLAALFMVLAPHHSGRTIRMRNFRFAPMDVRIAQGAAVTFVNESDDTHTATCVQCVSNVDTGDVQPGLSKTVTFRLPGTYIFACRYHQTRNMIMRIRVGNVTAERSPAPPAPTPT